MKPPIEVWQWLAKFGTEDDKKRFRPVYTYIQYLETRLKKLEGILDEQMSPQMFPKKTKLDTEIEKKRLIEESIKRSMSRKDEGFNGEPLKARLRRMLVDKQTETPEWAATLRWNNLTEDEAKALAGLDESS